MVEAEGNEKIQLHSSLLTLTYICLLNCVVYHWVSVATNITTDNLIKLFRICQCYMCLSNYSVYLSDPTFIKTSQIINQLALLAEGWKDKQIMCRVIRQHQSNIFRCKDLLALGCWHLDSLINWNLQCKLSRKNDYEKNKL